MVQPATEIPRPSPSDNETVITALETAAVFREKGDPHEAVRWLRRAAEGAAEVGDDQRALALSLKVADLHEELEVTLPRGSTRPYPPPPSSRAPLPQPPPPPSKPNGSHAPAPLRLSTPAPPPVSARPSAPAPSPMPSAPVASVRPSAPIASVRPSPPPLSVAGSRKAARVAITPSTTTPGSYEVRPLADNEAPRAGCAEALLVMLDPQSTLLSN